MSGKVIGKHMNLGFIGKVSRDADTIIDARVVSDSANEYPILFGAAVFINTDNTVRPILGTDTTLTKFAGIAVAEVKQSTVYLDSTSQYEKNQVCDVLTRGTITLPVSGTPTAGGDVYLRFTTTGATTFPTGKVGDFEAAADTGNYKVPNMKFATGYKDANGVAEVTLLSKNLI